MQADSIPCVFAASPDPEYSGLLTVHAESGAVILDTPGGERISVAAWDAVRLSERISLAQLNAVRLHHDFPPITRAARTRGLADRGERP